MLKWTICLRNEWMIRPATRQSNQMNSMMNRDEFMWIDIKKKRDELLHDNRSYSDGKRRRDTKFIRLVRSIREERREERHRQVHPLGKNRSDNDQNWRGGNNKWENVAPHTVVCFCSFDILRWESKCQFTRRSKKRTQLAHLEQWEQNADQRQRSTYQWWCFRKMFTVVTPKKKRKRRKHEYLQSDFSSFSEQKSIRKILLDVEKGDLSTVRWEKINNEDDQ